MINLFPEFMVDLSRHPVTNAELVDALERVGSDTRTTISQEPPVPRSLPYEVH